jgi:D-alanine-D-alanine ligase
MRGRVRVAVIGGGRNCEHEVSLASAAAAHAALDRDRYEPVALTICPEGGWLIDGRPADLADAVAVLQASDVALPLVHGVRGEDGCLAALCEYAGVPYAGSGVSAGAIGMDKCATKVLAAAAGIAVAPGYLVHRADLTRDARHRRWTGPVWSSRYGPGRATGSPWSPRRRGWHPRSPRRRSWITGSWSKSW